MSSQTKFTTSASVGSSGGSTWDNVTFVYTNDSNYATSTLMDSPDHYTKNIQAVHFDFAIPGKAILLGIEVETKAKVDDISEGTTLVCYLTLDGTTGAVGPKNTDNLTTSDVVYTFGSSSDGWGLTLPSQINPDTFGVLLGGTTGLSMAGAIVSVNYIKVTVTYKVKPSIIMMF